MTPAITELVMLSGAREADIHVPPGFVKIPVNLSRGTGGDHAYLAYRRGTEKPITGLKILEGKEAKPPKGWTRIGDDLNRGAGLFNAHLYLCTTKEDGKPITDLLVETDPKGTRTVPRDYDRITVDLRRHGGKEYLHFDWSRKPLAMPLDLSKGITPQMAEAAGKKLEVSRAQVREDRMLIRRQEVVVDRTDKIVRGQPYDRTLTEKRGVRRDEVDAVAREIGLDAKVGYGAFAAQVNAKLATLAPATYGTEEEVTQKERVHLPAEGVEREVRFCSVRDVLEVVKLPELTAVTRAESTLPHRACFVREGNGPLRAVAASRLEPVG